MARPKSVVVPDSGGAGEAVPVAAPVAPAAPAAEVANAADEAKADRELLDFTDSQYAFTASSAMAIEVQHDIEPIQADIEQAAVLFANGQDSAARAVLETSARAHQGASAERLWRMLLDLVQVTGDRATFEKLAFEFAQACETSPPTWRAAEPLVATGSAGLPVLLLQGVLAGRETGEIQALKAAVAKKQATRVDFGRLASCDEDAAGELVDVLRLARKHNVDLVVDNVAALAERLEKRMVMGQAESPRAWLLLLELYQRLGQQQAFEDKAIEYAVTFEVSPPSWEVVKQHGKANRPAEPAAPPAAEDAFYLSGELKNCRFEELRAYLDLHDRPVVDFSRVKRMDFFSAGLLCNTLEPFPRQGKEIVIRNPHHLVAELMGIVGLNGVARIIVPKI